MTDEHDNDLWKSRPEQDEELDAPPSSPTEAVPVVDVDEPLLRFSQDDGILPHWTEPPTGQMPAILADDASAKGDSELAAWSGFGAQAPVWRDDRSANATGPVETDFSYLDDGERPGALDESPLSDDPFLADDPDDSPIEEPVASAASPDRETPMTQPRVAAIRSGARATSGVMTGSSSTGAANGPRKAPDARRPVRTEPVRPGSGSRPAASGRNMGAAVAVGVALLVIFALASKLGKGYLVAIVVAVLAFAAVEFYDTVRRQGYQPAQLLGIVAVAVMPLAAYWRGSDGVMTVLAFAMIATLGLFMLSGSIESNPLPNTAATMLGIVYIGVLGSFAGLMLGQFQHGIHTLVALVVGTVAYDIFGLVFGSSIGKHPLVEWISPNKTWEGLLFGFLGAFLSIVVMSKFGKWTPWNVQLMHGIQLGLVVGIAAPLGDLAESMLKRSLGVKDFGNILPGHGGVLDRFDCYLFSLPAVYFLCRMLNVY
jgi:phosphatidate cytidylyltransferase